MTQLTDLVASEINLIEAARGNAYVAAGAYCENLKTQSKTKYDADLASAQAAFNSSKNQTAFNAAITAAARAHGIRVDNATKGYNAAVAQIEKMYATAMAKLKTLEQIAQNTATTTTNNANSATINAMVLVFRTVTSVLPRPIYNNSVSASGGIRG